MDATEVGTEGRCRVSSLLRLMALANGLRVVDGVSRLQRANGPKTRRPIRLSRRTVQAAGDRYYETDGGHSSRRGQPSDREAIAHTS